jgi:hypothetical protein
MPEPLLCVFAPLRDPFNLTIFLQRLLVSAERAEKITKSAHAGPDEFVSPLSSATLVQVAGSDRSLRKNGGQWAAWLMFCF